MSLTSFWRRRSQHRKIQFLQAKDATLIVTINGKQVTIKVHEVKL